MFVLFLVQFGLLGGHLLEKWLLIRFTMCSLCILAVCDFGGFPFWFRGLDLGSSCFGSWSLDTFCFLKTPTASAKYFVSHVFLLRLNASFSGLMTGNIVWGIAKMKRMQRPGTEVIRTQIHPGNNKNYK